MKMDWKVFGLVVAIILLLAGGLVTFRMTGAAGTAAQLRQEFEAYKIKVNGEIAGLQSQVDNNKRSADSQLASQKSAYELADSSLKSACDSANNALLKRVNDNEDAISKIKNSLTTPSPNPTPVYPTPVPYVTQFTATAYRGVNFDGGSAGTFTENSVNHNYSATGPFGLTSSYSIRWQGNVWVDAGNRTFSITVDDGARLYVDGNLVINLWRVGPQISQSTSVYYPGAGYHSIVLEYFQVDGPAIIQLAIN